MKHKKHSIKTRILLGVLLLIGIAFALIFVVFNISVDHYIDINAKRQLDIAQDIMGEELNKDREIHNEEAPLSNIYSQPRNPVGAKAEMFFWNGKSILALDSFSEDVSMPEEIAAQLDIDAALEATQTISVQQGAFLVSAMERPQTESEYIVFYVDITDIQTMTENINSLLIIVLVAVGAGAVGIAFLLANSVAKPILQISKFAKKIGEGVFEEQNIDMKDSEISDLLDVMNTTAGKLKRYDNEQKTFFQNVSHELKTPLMTIRCNAEGIERHVMPPDKSSRVIINETDLLGELIDDLLYISKMDTITDSDVLMECDLRELLSNSAERHKTLAMQKSIVFEYHFSKAPVMKAVSEKSMQRVFNNLISNAVRHAQSKIILSCRTGEDHQAIISVWDDGAGISQEDLPHIFERFYKTKQGGHGIGLSIVKSVVDKLGGHIYVRTDNGTEFSLVI